VGLKGGKETKIIAKVCYIRFVSTLHFRENYLLLLTFIRNKRKIDEFRQNINKHILSMSFNFVLK
jgi:hypothetical protein